MLLNFIKPKWKKKLKIISNTLLKAFKAEIKFDLNAALLQKAKEEIPFDYFEYHNSVSSVYSSMTEGEPIEADSYLKHKIAISVRLDWNMRAWNTEMLLTFWQWQLVSCTQGNRNNK